MISEELVTYKTAHLAKQAGFDVPVNKYWCNYYTGAPLTKWKLLPSSELSLNWMEYPAPSQSLLQRWIREVCNYEVQVHYLPNIEVYCCTYTPKAVKPNTFKSVEKFKKHVSQYYSTKRHKTYELALEQALQEALTIIIKRKETNNG